jgi:hypothetical protein
MPFFKKSKAESVMVLPFFYFQHDTPEKERGMAKAFFGD